MGKRAIEVSLNGMDGRISKRRREFKDKLVESSMAIAQDGARVMQLMVPHNTGTLEESIEGNVAMGSDGVLKINVGTDSNEVVNGTPVKVYAQYMNDGFVSRTGNAFFPYKLGKRSLDKVATSKPYKVGDAFVQRASKYMRRHYRQQFLQAAKDVGFVNASWKGRSR